MVVSTDFNLLLYWRPCSSYSQPSSERTEVTLYSGHGSEEYVGPAHICARGKLRHLNLREKHKLGSMRYDFFDNV